MARVRVALVLLAALLALALGDLSTEGAADVANAKDNSKADSSKGQDENAADAKEQKPSKKELRRQAAEDAENSYQKSLRNADSAMGDLEKYIADYGRGENVSQIVERIQARAVKANEKQASQANDAVSEGLKKVSKAGQSGDDEAVAAATNETMKAVSDAEKLQGAHLAKAMKDDLNAMEKDSKKEARQMGDKAKKAARAALKEARKLEKAQRQAGDSEQKFEGIFEVNEHLTEGMSNRAERLRDHAEDRVEDFYKGLEDAVESRMHDVRSQATQRASKQRASVAQASDDAKREASKVRAEKEAAAAKEAAEKKEEAAAKQKEQASKDAKDSKNKTGASDTEKKAEKKEDAAKDQQKKEEKADSEAKDAVKGAEKNVTNDVKKAEAPKSEGNATKAEAPQQLAAVPDDSGLSVILAGAAIAAVIGLLARESWRRPKKQQPLLG